ncbi:hypothetical protein ACIO3O_37030 [Streptomyces sp. NPDC087440]|uniref:hypothetical protein n=1 Tax=Streptomyces sp. NPDC087440 TaxID=3365790 RepID=UPI0037F8C23C
MTTATPPALTTDDITVTTDAMGRLVVIVPDDVARPLTTASHEGVNPKARSLTGIVSRDHAADSWAALTIRTIFAAVLDAYQARTIPEHVHMYGLSQYAKWDGGTLYGHVVGTSGWDTDTRWWREYRKHNDLIPMGPFTIWTKDRRNRAGMCQFGS